MDVDDEDNENQTEEVWDHSKEGLAAIDAEAKGEEDESDAKQEKYSGAASKSPGKFFSARNKASTVSAPLLLSSHQDPWKLSQRTRSYSSSLNKMARMNYTDSNQP